MKTKKLVTKLLKQIQVLRQEQKLMFEKVQPVNGCGCGETIVIPADRPKPTGTPVSIDRLPAAIGVNDDDEKKGLALLFEQKPKKVLYRHYCPACKVARVNHEKAATCNRCKKVMVTNIVKQRGKNGSR